MKKSLLFPVIMFVVLGVCSLQAQNEVVVLVDEPIVIEDELRWEFIQIGFYVDTPSNQSSAKANGIRIGAPISGGSAEVNGLEAAVLCAATDYVNGVQFSIVNVAKQVCGLQLGIVNVAEDKTFQVGLLNFVKDGWLPFCILFNFQF